MTARQESGFTLIELMITVVIIGILAAVAFPNYSAYMRDSRRADCKTVMLSYASALERRFSIDSAYPDDELPGFVCPVGGGAATYEIEYESDGATFTLTATPTGGQSDDRCGILSLTNTGRREAAELGCW